MISKFLLDIKISRFLKKHNASESMIVKCIIETFFISANINFDIFAVDSNAVLPYFECDNITRAEYQDIVERELPILLYNAILVNGFPITVELERSITELEDNLVKLKDNVWVKCILRHYYKRVSFDMEMFLELDDETATAYGAARAHYNTYCVAALNKIKKALLEKKNKKEIMNWLSENKIKCEN